MKICTLPRGTGRKKHGMINKELRSSNISYGCSVTDGKLRGVQQMFCLLFSFLQMSLSLFILFLFLSVFHSFSLSYFLSFPVYFLIHSFLIFHPYFVVSKLLP